MITNRIKRGANASLPNGAAGEPLFTTDTYDLYIGKGDGTNQRYQKYMADAINGTGVANQLAYFSGANTIAGSTFLTLNLTADNGYLILTGGATYKNADIWLNRYSNAWENAIRFQTNGTTDWYVGSSATGSNSDFEIYNYGTSANGIKIAKATNNVTVGGTLTATVGALATAATNFVTSDSGTLKSRTAAEVLSDIGAQATFGNQTANTVFAGPTTGSAAAPTFRSLVAADIPALPYVSGSGVDTRLAIWTGTDTISNNVNLTFDGVTLSVNGRYRTGGSASNTVKFKTGGGTPLTDTFNTVIADGTGFRSAYFRGNSTTGASVWWGALDSNGDNIPLGAIDANYTDGGLSFWRNAGGVGGGAWTKIFTYDGNGVKLDVVSALGTAATSFIVSDSGLLKTRTATQVRSDIGAAAASDLSNYLPLAGGTITGFTQFSYDNNYVSLNRSATDKYLGFLYETGGDNQWFIGLRELSNNNYYIYNETLSNNAVTISVANNNATFAGSVTASISALATAATLYLVSDSGTIKSRTPAQVRSDIGAQVSGNYVTLDTTQTITSRKTLSYQAVAYSGTTQSFLIDGAEGNGAITINSNGESPFAYQTFAQGGAAKFEMGIVGTDSNGSFYINRNVQTGSTGASIYIKKADGNVGILNLSPQHPLDVTGNIRATLNQNGLTRVLISNTTAGTSSYVETRFDSDTAAGGASVGKYSSTTTPFKIVTEGNTFLYNDTAGDIAILNNFATGAIKMAAGGSTTAHFTIASTGAATFANNLFNNGLFRTAGTTNAVKYNSGAASLTFGAVLGDSGGSTNRTAFFRSSSTTSVSTWYGGVDGNGDNIPWAAIDAVADQLQFYVNPGGTGGGTFTQISSISSAGTKLDVLSALATAATTFLVSDSKIVKTRTAAQVLSDIGAQPSGNYVTLDTTQTITGKKTFSNAFGDNDPIVALVGTSTATFQYLTTSYNASLEAGKNVCHFFGRGSATKNSAYIGFQYNDANSNTNFLTLGLYANDHILKIYGSGYSEFKDFVGVGVNPSYKLQVYTNSDVWHTVIGGATGELRIGGQTSSGAVIQARNAAGDSRLLYLQRDGSNVIINGTTDTGDRLYVNGTARIESRLGIGVSSAIYSLQLGTVGSLTNSIRMGTYEVPKNTRQYIGYTRDDDGKFETSGGGDTVSTVYHGVAAIRFVNTEGTVLNTKADNSIQLITHIYNGNSRIALHASYNGRVGINGVTAPAQALDVSGSIRQSGVTSSMLKTNASGDIIAAVAGTDYQAAGNYVTTDTTQTIASRKTISYEAVTYGGTAQSFLIDGAAGNAALTINAAADYAYLTFAQAGSGKIEIGCEGATTNKGSLYINKNIQVGSNGASIYIKKSDGYVGINNVNPQYVLDVSGSVRTTNSFISTVSNSYGLVLNRPAVTNYNGISLQTAGSARWYIGMRENLSSNNFICYSEQTATDVMTLNIADNSATFAGNLFNNGLLRTAGSSNVVWWSGATQTASFGSVFGDSTTARTAFFRSSSTTTAASVWWGLLDSSGRNIPCAAIDGTNGGGLSFWNNTGGSGGGTWTKIFEYNANGVGINTTPSATYKLDVSGSVRATSGFYDTSDMRLKSNIRDYNEINILNVNAKIYEKNGKIEIGYLAQDLQGILDNAISIADDGFLNLQYRQVHTAKIAALEAKIKELESKLN